MEYFTMSTAFMQINMLFSEVPIMALLTMSLRVVISWMNLDLGFQVCFYSGMTAYQKIWLEYCFLLYLLLLGLLIVCLSHKYIWFTRLVGRNVVPVLSTVVSISFYKLITNLLKVFACSSKYYWTTEGKKPLIWLEDETMDCLTGKHIPLLILSIILSDCGFSVYNVPLNDSVSTEKV